MSPPKAVHIHMTRRTILGLKPNPCREQSMTDHMSYSMAERLCDRSSAASRESCTGVEELSFSKTEPHWLKEENMKTSSQITQILKQLQKLRLPLTRVH